LRSFRAFLDDARKSAVLKLQDAIDVEMDAQKLLRLRTRLVKSLGYVPEGLASIYNPLPKSWRNFPLKPDLGSSETTEAIGFVYVLTNPSFPGLVKIGYTERDPSLRIKELNGTGLPYEFIEVIRINTVEAKKLEMRLHRHFQTKRVNSNREFFAVSTQEVYDTLLKWNIIEK